MPTCPMAKRNGNSKLNGKQINNNYIATAKHSYIIFCTCIIVKTNLIIAEPALYPRNTRNCEAISINNMIHPT